VSLNDLRGVEAWRSVWNGARHDSRFYEILDGSVPPFEYHYLVLEDRSGRVRAIQPVFIHDQDILEGIPEQWRRAVRLATAISPSLTRIRVLWVGPTVGEAALGAEPRDLAWCAWALQQTLPLAARRLRARMVILKDFPSELRPLLQVFLDQGYTRVPSMPAVSLDLTFGSFEEHALTLSSKTRFDLRRKRRDAGRLPPVSLEVRSDISDRLDELYPLYLQVHDRSALRFETLTPQYFRRLGREMPDRVRFFIWSQEGRAIAFDTCFVQDGVLEAAAIGLDYRIALNLHLYFIVKRDVIDWACRHGIRRYVSGPLNYDPKLRLGFKLQPLDLYVWHRSSLVNGILKRAAPWLTPARHEPLLQRFPNAHEL
jgi:predicted N-acyltransferase